MRHTRRRLPASGWAQQRYEFAAADAQIDVVEHGAGAVALG